MYLVCSTCLCVYLDCHTYIISSVVPLLVAFYMRYIFPNHQGLFIYGFHLQTAYAVDRSLEFSRLYFCVLYAK
jgi:hypothetical protein